MLSLYLWIITQIITESLPMSSSSHLRLIEIMLQRYGTAGFLMRMPPYFDDLLHIPHLISLSLFFFKRWFFLLIHLKRLYKLIAHIIVRIFISSTITVLFYVLFNYTEIVKFSFVIGLIITALILYSSSYITSTRYESFTWRKAVVLGIVQGIALLPGISRLASTYVAARWLNLSPRHALEISFAIQVPLVLAAVARSLLYLHNWPYTYEFLNVPTLLVMLVSTVGAYMGLMLTWWCAQRNIMWIFSYYLLIPIILALCIGG